MSKSFEAVIFDLDGVITKTALVHSLAWKKMFDEYLKGRAQKEQKPFEEFTHNNDYLPYVDGKPRYKGVASFLLSRGIKLDYGHVDDTLEKETVCGLGNRKNQAFTDVLQKDGVQVYASTVKLIKQLLQKGIKVGVASSSKNCQVVLEAAGLSHLFETRVDGVVSVELKLQGKPEPDIFTTACDNLGVTYDRAVIVEDAVSGVQAGKKGNFGLVIGIAREDNEEELNKNGADIVVKDLEDINIKEINNWFEEDTWRLSYTDYDSKKEKVRETLLTVGNGYFGTRGAAEEQKANEVNYPGTYIAGLYNRLESKVADRMISNEDFVNCPNWLYITFKIGETGKWFDLNKTEIVSIKRTLYFKTGVYERKLVVRDQQGRETLIESKRVASMQNPHLAALQYNVTPLNYNEKIFIKSELDGNLINAGVDRYKQLNSKHLKIIDKKEKNENSYIVAETNQSKVRIAMAAKLKVTGNLKVEKLVTIYTSRDQGVVDPLEAALKDLKAEDSFEKIAEKSGQKWQEIWAKIDAEIEGDNYTQKLLRLHLYHLMVSASLHNVNIDAGYTARGLHGEAYRGHIFWDEVYILPFYNRYFPEVAKAILMYRVRRLDKAREYARQNGYKGAMYPWQSGSDGSEETPTIHLNPISGKWGADYSCYQRHVSLAVIYNIWQYYGMTKDLKFMEEYGAEVFLEVCRFWADRAKLDSETGRYSIKNVMGPDEFHEKYKGTEEGGLKDNTYTNIMCVWMFRRVKDLLKEMSEQAKEKLFKKIDLAASEIKEWDNISKKMNLVISKDGILAQFDGYFDLKELDWDYYRKKYGDIARMDRILKAEGKSADEYKVAKQADTLMIFYTLGKEEVEKIIKDLGYKVEADLLKKNFYYYIERTSHGSTLSKVVHSYLANIIGETELSRELYKEALESDYVDIQGGTTGEGIHTGVMAGTILLAMDLK
ncbi:beta-phosphoglucomutase family hydrolase [bacterium]|nr:beta-phosphoglucomutase family hydrolase [bacterium]